jgi:hypothetical protein
MAKRDFKYFPESKLSSEEIDLAREELMPLIARYRESEARQIPLGSRVTRRLLELSNKLSDYYVSAKEWVKYSDYLAAMREIDPFKMFHHRESLRSRVLALRQPEIFGK